MYIYIYKYIYMYIYARERISSIAARARVSCRLFLSLYYSRA